MSKAKNFTSLPEGYILSKHIDLQHDKKAMLLVNGFGIAMMLILIVAGIFLLPVSPLSLFDMSNGFGTYTIRWIAMLLMMVVYLVLHEAVHGIAMMAFGHCKPHFGFTGLYAFAGSDDFFCKADYIIISLAPAIVWTIVLSFLTAVVPSSWTWCFYAVQIANISGCCGDFYVTGIVSRYPSSLLIQDDGTSMKMYLPERS